MTVGRGWLVTPGRRLRPRPIRDRCRRAIPGRCTLAMLPLPLLLICPRLQRVASTSRLSLVPSSSGSALLAADNLRVAGGRTRLEGNAANQASRLGGGARSHEPESAVRAVHAQHGGLDRLPSAHVSAARPRENWAPGAQVFGYTDAPGQPPRRPRGPPPLKVQAASVAGDRQVSATRTMS